MPRKPRLDPPDSWHHVVNRGIAKRPMFEHRDDMRYFLSRLARQVRSGRIEVHAFCLLQTHFHLLLRSPHGQLSEAMRRIQNAYVRRFNRLRRRDGSLARGRFFSRIVDSDAYLHALVRYIDLNPVRAGLVAAPAGWEFGSAAHYLKGTRPPWLRRDWIEQQASLLAGSAGFSPTAYRRAFSIEEKEHEAALVDLVEARMAAADREDTQDGLLAAALGEPNAWMRWKTRLADGGPFGQPACGVRTLLEAFAQDRRRNGDWLVADGRATRRGDEPARIGLLRSLCGMSLRTIADLDAASLERVRRLHGEHRRLLRDQEAYARRVMLLAQAAVAAALWPATGRVRHRCVEKQPHGA